MMSLTRALIMFKRWWYWCIRESFATTLFERVLV